MVAIQAPGGECSQRRATRPLRQLLIGLLLFELFGWSALCLGLDRQLGLSGPFWFGVAASAIACLLVLLAAQTLVARRGRFTLKEFLVGMLLIGAVCGWIGNRYQQKQYQRHVARVFQHQGLGNGGIGLSGDDRPGLARLIGPEYFYDINSIQATACQLTAREMGILRGLKELQLLTLGGKRVTDDHLEPLAEVPKLSRLNLNRDNRCTGAGLLHLRDHPSLECLSLDGLRFDEQQLVHLQRIPNLKQLTLAFRVTEAGMSHLGRCRNLEWLCLEDADRPALAHLAGLPRLKALRIKSSSVGNADLAPLVHLRNLTSLSLDCPQVSDAGLEHIAKAGSLERLDLTGTSVSANGLDCIESMEQLKFVRFNYRNVALIQRAFELRARRSELSISN